SVSGVSEIEVDMYNLTIHVDGATRRFIVNGLEQHVPYYWPSKDKQSVPDIIQFQGQNTLCGVGGNLDNNYKNDVVYRNGTVFQISRNPVKYDEAFNRAEDTWITSNFLKIRPNSPACLTGQQISNLTNCVRIDVLANCGDIGDTPHSQDSQEAATVCDPIKQAMYGKGTFSDCSVLGNDTIQEEILATGERELLALLQRAHLIPIMRHANRLARRLAQTQVHLIFAINRYGCDQYATCTVSGEAMSCVCLPGFTGNGTTCVDIDECLDPTTCNANKGYGNCTNTIGSYHCDCDLFFTQPHCQNYLPRRHCADLRHYWGITVDGVYVINPPYVFAEQSAFTNVTVYCDMTTGWFVANLVKSDSSVLICAYTAMY
ncbi:EGF-like domain protein, partial [Necator americanus]